MLRYMNRGLRSGRSAHPLGVQRGNWEFFAVVRGSTRPVFPERPMLPLQTRRLWLMPPDSPHTWMTAPGKTCEVCVFHFASIHPLLEAALPAARAASIPLSDDDARALPALHRELAPHYAAPRRSSAVHFEAAMLRLCALFLERDREASSLAAFDEGAEKILRALQWHREHLREGVGVKEVAAALHVSPGHLRRLFLRLRRETPKRVLLRAMIEEACRLMAQSTLSLKEVGARCGFAGFSEFYRAFKTHTGQTPSEWRSNCLYRGLGLDTSRLAANQADRAGIRLELRRERALISAA